MVRSAVKEAQSKKPGLAPRAMPRRLGCIFRRNSSDKKDPACTDRRKYGGTPKTRVRVSARGVRKVPPLTLYHTHCKSFLADPCVLKTAAEGNTILRLGSMSCNCHEEMKTSDGNDVLCSSLTRDKAPNKSTKSTLIGKDPTSDLSNSDFPQFTMRIVMVTDTGGT